MQSRGSLLLAARSRKGFAFLVIALFMLSLAFQYAAAMVPRSVLAADAPVVTLEDGVEGCMGVRTTPGSENTHKRLTGGSLVPGGTAEFTIDYPVDPSDVAGRTTFVITDCVFIGDKPVLKYSVSFVPNTTDYVLKFKLVIPAGTPIGAEYCNYAKTTAAPSDSQASNRKAGPACFIVGGNISVLKVNEAGKPLAGATFHIVCTLPKSSASMPDTIIDGVSHHSTSGGVITQDVTTDATGRIAIQAPEGTSCVITETHAPDGYDLPADPSVTLVATAGGVHHTFVDPKSFVPAPGLNVSKGVSLSASGPFTASLTAEIGTTVYYRITITNTGNVPLTGVTLTDNVYDLAGLGCDVPTTLAVGAHFTCDYSHVLNAADAAGSPIVNTATGDSEETGSDKDTATVTVTTSPGLNVTKGVSTSASGPFGHNLSVQVGTTVYYRITISNTGNVELTAVELSDTITSLAGKCSVPTTLAVGASFDCNYSAVMSTVGTTVNTATGDSAQTGPDSDTATVVVTATPPPPTLTIEKSNNAPIVNVAGKGLHTAPEGSTVTFTLTYTSQNGAATNAVITDVIPTGLTYVAGSATSNGTFTFAGYDAGTRTLKWNAASVSSSGSVSYQAKVDTGAAGLQQPLRNLAAVDSDNTEKDTAHSDVFVPVPPLAETSVPTAPRTDVLTSGGTSAPGSNMGLVLLALAVLAFALVFVTPVPSSVRSRIRRR